jgi:hypothetical protein
MKKIRFLCLLLASTYTIAQTDIDGIMMTKDNFCSGLVYEFSSWDHYWEGEFYRDNQNLGTVSTQKISVMGNYGISRKWNVLFNLNYISTKASAGTLAGQEGLQDLTLTTKFMPLEISWKENILAFYAIGSLSVPTTNYAADYLPLTIGNQSTTGTIRLMADLQKGNFFATVSQAYIKRSNITIDRDVYFTTVMHYTNEVDMPDVLTFNGRIGYRTNRVIAEAIFDSWITQDGFDMTLNNMPFPSNRMNVSKIGLNGKYYFQKIPNLSLIAGYSHVITGRNVGQSNTFYAGLFYIINFKKEKKDEKVSQ